MGNLEWDSPCAARTCTALVVENKVDQVLSMPQTQELQISTRPPSVRGRPVRLLRHGTTGVEDDEVGMPRTLNRDATSG